MSASEQEVLVKLFAQSMGAPWLFEPEEYAVGSGTREPPDLVWYGPDCVIFMFQTRTGKLDRAIEHNLKQAGGWMRVWKTLRVPLRGKNVFQSFDLTYEPGVNVIVLSVIAGTFTDVREHAQHAARMGVRACYTIPESVLKLLAEQNGSVVDLLGAIPLMASVQRQNGPMDPVQLLRLIHHGAMAEGAMRARYGIDPPSSTAQKIFYSLALNRMPVSGESPLNDSAPSLWYSRLRERHHGDLQVATGASACFCDFSFADQFQILYEIDVLLSHIRPGVCRGIFDVIDLEGYSLGVSLCRGLDAYFAQKFPKSADVYFHLEIESGASMCAIGHLRLPSRTRQVLDRFWPVVT